ncbi:MAG: hypothetical protein ACLUEQ_00435 [Cloacibacillus evryensis]
MLAFQLGTVFKSAVADMRHRHRLRYRGHFTLKVVEVLPQLFGIMWLAMMLFTPRRC